MHKNDRFVVLSLELHLFFARIMKEHSLFLMAAFTPANADFTKRAEHFKRRFEDVLSQAVALSDGIVSRRVLTSGELFTPFTARAEQQTECLTGISINQNITARESLLRFRNCNSCNFANPKLYGQVQSLNQAASHLLDGLITLKEQILSNVLCGRMFTMNYPLLIEHITREAKLYRDYLCQLEKDGDLDPQSMGQMEMFWNQIMMEHALFIRGLLDPSEEELADTAGCFAQDYARLLESCRTAHDKTLTKEALAETCKFRDFKAAGTRGIEECKIRSIILPLLADHVLREANHYIRLLSE